MRVLFFLFLLYDNFQCREQGPPDIDSVYFERNMYYYDIYINETTTYLPVLNPIYDKCSAVYISGTLKVTHRELTMFFKQFRYFANGIRVENTNLENLSFLIPHYVKPLDDSEFSIEIIGNKNLTRLGMYYLMNYHSYEKILIANNPMLDLRDECDKIIIKYGTLRVITDNLVDCGCTIKESFNNFIKTISPNCWMLFGNVIIDQDSDLSILQEKMVNVTRISGGLSVINTNFTNLSFLSSVEWIETNIHIVTHVTTNIIITNNINLISLNMTAKRDGLYLVIRDNPKLCVTPQELDMLFYGFSDDSDLDVSICYDAETPSYWCQLPDSGYFSGLPDGCINVTGNLVLDENFDFDNSYKLYDVKHLYGSLTIKNSYLRSLNMLPRLASIRSTKANVVPVYIFNNTKLMKSIDTLNIESGMPATILNNSNLIVLENTCKLLKSRKPVVVRANFKNCADFVEIPKKKYDRTPSNYDFYKGLPTFLEVSHGTGDFEYGNTQNNPWERNLTYYYDENEQFETATENGYSVVFEFKMTLVLIQIIHFY